MVRDTKTICFVALEIYPSTPGGAGILLYHTICRLLEDGFEVILLLDITHDEFVRLQTSDKFNYPNIECLHVYSLDDLCEGMRLPSSAFPDHQVWRSAQLATAMEKLIDRHSIDLLEFYDYCGPAYHFLATSAARRTNVVIRLHNTIELIDRKVRNRPTPERLYHYAMERAQLAAADAVLTPGLHYFKEDVQPHYGTFVDPDRCLLSPPITRSFGEVTYNLDGRDVVFYGRLSTLKGLDTFLLGGSLALDDEAFSSWVDRILVIGPEETVASAVSLADMKANIPARHKHRFQFVGRRSHADLMEDLADTAFACFTSRSESYCYAAHELHLAGIPLIVRNTSAFLDHFTDGENTIFFDGTAGGLAKAMIQLAGDPQLRRALSASRSLNAPRYVRNYYPDHLEALSAAAQARARAVRPCGSVTALVFCGAHSSDHAIRHTEESLTPLADHIIRLRALTNSNAEGGWGSSRFGQTFAGLDWSMSAADGRDFRLEEAGDALIGLRAGDLVREDWFAEACAALSDRSKIGSVGGWAEVNHDIRVSLHNLLPEFGVLSPVGGRTLIRLPPGLRICEALALGHAAGEVSMLLAHRAAGRACLELPRPAVDATEALATPYLNLEQALAVEADRMSPAFLSLVVGLKRLPDASLATLSDRDVDEDLKIYTRLSPGAAVLRTRPDRIDGEVWLLRLFRERDRFHEPWSSVTFSEGWDHKVAREDGGGGCYWTKSEGQAVFFANAESSLEVLTGPYCGAIDVYFAGGVFHVDLNRSEVGSGFLDFGDLTKGVADMVLAPRVPTPADQPPPSSALRQLFGGRDAATTCLSVRGADDTGLMRAVSSDDRVLTVSPEELGLVDDRASPLVAGHLRAIAARTSIERLVLSSSAAASLTLAHIVTTEDIPLKISLILEGKAAGWAPELEAKTSPYAADLKTIVTWIEFAGNAGDRLEVMSATSAYLPIFAAKGCRALKAPLPLPHPSHMLENAKDGIELLIVGSPRLVPSLSHMIAACMMLDHTDTPVARVWIPSAAASMRSVWEGFGPRRAALFYDSLDEVLGTRRLQCAFALAVFPEAEPPAQLPNLIAAGFLPILGSSDALVDEASGRPVGGRVVFWDNAVEIAQEVQRLAGDYAAEYRRLQDLADARDAALEAFLAAWNGPSRATGELAETVQSDDTSAQDNIVMPPDAHRIPAEGGSEDGDSLGAALSALDAGSDDTEDGDDARDLDRLRTP